MGRDCLDALDVALVDSQSILGMVAGQRRLGLPVGPWL